MGEAERRRGRLVHILESSTSTPEMREEARRLLAEEDAAPAPGGRSEAAPLCWYCARPCQTTIRAHYCSEACADAATGASAPAPAELPARVEVGPMAFRITEDESEYASAVIGNEGQLWGQISYGRGVIVLNPGQSDDHKRFALFHELMHAVWHQSDRAHDGDEEVIRRVAAPLLDMLRRNPELMAYLLRKD